MLVAAVDGPRSAQPRGGTGSSVSSAAERDQEDADHHRVGVVRVRHDPCGHHFKTVARLDDGQVWVPSEGSSRMTVMPAPGARELLGLGGLRGVRRRR